MGLNEAQIRQYLEVMGLTPEQIDTAIKVSGLEESRAKLEAYASLLEGKIPGSVAASVIASVEAGDVEGAAQQLAQFAATNPIDIPLTVTVDQPAITTAQDAVDELERVTLRIPPQFDRVRAALGGYTDAETAGLQALSAAAEAAQTDIAAAIESGAARDEVIGLAATYEAEFRKILASYGVVGEAADTYVAKLLGLDQLTVTNAVQLAGVEEAVNLLTIYRTVLDEVDSFELSDQLEIADLLSAGDFEGARARILAEIEAARTEIESAEPAEVPVGVNTTGAVTGLAEWRRNEAGIMALVPADATTSPADLVMAEWRITEEGRQVIVPVGGNINPAIIAANALTEYITSLRPQMNVDIVANFAQNATAIPFLANGFIPTGTPRSGRRGSGRRGSGGVPVDQIPGFPTGGGIDNDPRTPYAVGGFVSGPGTGTSDSIPAMLSNGEYVIRAAAVRSLGVNFLDKLNKGYVSGFSMGGVVGDTPTPGGPAVGGINVDYTVVEAQSKPKPDDLVRTLNSARFLNRFATT